MDNKDGFRLLDVTLMVAGSLAQCAASQAKRLAMDSPHHSRQSHHHGHWQVYTSGRCRKTLSGLWWAGQQSCWGWAADMLGYGMVAHPGDAPLHAPRGTVDAVQPFVEREAASPGALAIAEVNVSTVPITWRAVDLGAHQTDILTPCRAHGFATPLCHAGHLRCSADCHVDECKAHKQRLALAD